MGKSRKRKSEGSDIPEKERSQRFKTTGNIYNSGPDHGESSDELCNNDRASKARRIQKQPIKSRKSEPVRRLDRSDEYDEDAGRLETQEFLDMVKIQQDRKRRDSKSTTEYMEVLAKAMQTDEEGLTQHIKNLDEELARSKKAFLQAFSDAYECSRPTALPNRNVPHGNKALDKGDFASMYELSNRLTANAIAIIEKFEGADAETTKFEAVDLIEKKAWADELNELEAILDSGYAAGLEKYQRMLRTSKHATGDDDDVITKAFYPSLETSANIGWAQIAKKAEKATRKLLRALPLKDAH